MEAFAIMILGHVPPCIFRGRDIVMANPRTCHNRFTTVIRQIDRNAPL